MARIRAAVITGLSVAALLVGAASPALAHRETAPPHGSDEAFGDANGSASGCGTELSEDGWEIRQFRVCEATQGCAGWRFTSG